MKKFGMIMYIIFAIGMGMAAPYGCLIFLFNWGNGFLSTNNKPVAITAAITTLLGIIFFLIAGKKIFKNNVIVFLAFLVMIFTSIFIFPMFLGL